MNYVIHLLVMGAFIAYTFAKKLQVGTEKKDLIKSIMIAGDAVLLEIIVNFVFRMITNLTSSLPLLLAILNSLLLFAIFCFANMLLAAGLEYRQINYLTIELFAAAIICLILIQVWDYRITINYVKELQHAGSEVYSSAVLENRLSTPNILEKLVMLAPVAVYDIFAIRNRMDEKRYETDDPELAEQMKNWRKH